MVNWMEMRVVQAPVQTVEEIYQSVCAAVASKKPIEAVYQGRPRLFCPHKLGRNRECIVARFAINRAAKARADSARRVHLQIRVVWRSISAAG